VEVNFTKRNGMGGESIYGSPFADEDLSRELDSAGLLCMANKGPNTNGSQFFVTLRACSHLNGKHVVFGKVIKGYEVFEKITDVPVDAKDRPSVPVVISNCGELELRKKVEQDTDTQKEKAREPGSNSADDDDDSDVGRKRQSKRSKRCRHRSRSLSDRDDDSVSESEPRNRRHRKRRKEKKEKKDVKENRPSSKARSVVEEERKETEEEYDARLEREENERIEAERKRHLELVKARHHEDQISQNGVRFKGRGKMKFIDPEIQRRPVQR